MKASILVLIHIIFQQASPQVLKLIISFAGSKEEEYWKGFFYVTLLVCINICMTVMMMILFLVLTIAMMF